MYFGSRVQKVVYFPSDNSDLLSSHFSVQSEVHYFWTVSGRILVYSQKYTTFSMVVPVGGYIVVLVVAYGTVPGQQYR